MPIETVDLRGPELAWYGFDLVTAPECQTWDQSTWRSLDHRGSLCCYGSHLALAAGGRWVVDIDATRRRWIDGRPVTTEDMCRLNGAIEQYMTAKDEDPPHLLEKVRGRKVVHVRFRAARLIGLNPEEPHDLGGVFSPYLTAPALARVLEDLFGPRPRH